MTSCPLVARLDGGPAHSALAPRGAAVEPPYIHVHRTKTAGWQVIHVCKGGERVVRHRKLDLKGALLLGAAMARVNECQLEVDR